MTADTRGRTDHTGTRRLSEGIEQQPDTPDKRTLWRFSRAASSTTSSAHDRTPGSPI
jgi:hypothetical protein